MYHTRTEQSIPCCPEAERHSHWGWHRVQLHPPCCHCCSFLTQRWQGLHLIRIHLSLQFSHVCLFRHTRTSRTATLPWAADPSTSPWWPITFPEVSWQRSDPSQSVLTLNLCCELSFVTGVTLTVSFSVHPSVRTMGTRRCWIKSQFCIVYLLTTLLFFVFLFHTFLAFEISVEQYVWFHLLPFLVHKSDLDFQPLLLTTQCTTNPGPLLNNAISSPCPGHQSAPEAVSHFYRISCYL